jgi:hypothetical protein
VTAFCNWEALTKLKAKICRANDHLDLVEYFVICLGNLPELLVLLLEAFLVDV